MTETTKEKTHYGKDCPKGKVQIEFVGCSPNDRINEYGWKPCDSTFLEVYVDGQRYRIDVGNFRGGDGSYRRGIHVCGPMDFKVDHHSCNALDIFHEEKPNDGKN